MAEVVLYQPQIPQNTGNIVRTCSVTGTSLTLVHPLGFDISEKQVRRAGLDYWNEVDITETDSLTEYLDQATSPFYLFTSKATKSYTDVEYPLDAILVFGSETKGIDDEILERYADSCVTIPMAAGQRCLNLSNAVAIAIYEGWRQHNFQFTELTL